MKNLLTTREAVKEGELSAACIRQLIYAGRQPTSEQSAELVSEDFPVEMKLLAKEKANQ